MKYSSLLLFVFVTALVVPQKLYANPKRKCSEVNYTVERSKLKNILSNNDYPSEERRFLLTGMDRRVKEIRENNLNERGAACGIAAVRAQIIGCMNSQLPSAMRTSSDLWRKTGTKMWGKTNITRRESLVIGFFHACRLGAMTTLTTIK